MDDMMLDLLGFQGMRNCQYCISKDNKNQNIWCYSTIQPTQKQVAIFDNQIETKIGIGGVIVYLTSSTKK